MKVILEFNDSGEAAEFIKKVTLVPEGSQSVVNNIFFDSKLNVQDLAAALKKTFGQLASSL